MSKGRKAVYSGYQEGYFTGIELKEKYKGNYYTGGRHHTTVYNLTIPIMLDLIGVQDNTTYRVFYNDNFCRVMRKDTDGLIKFFGHSDMTNVIECNHEDSPTSCNCPQCGKLLKLKRGRFGEFIACSGYPECRYTSNIQLRGTHIH